MLDKRFIIFLFLLLIALNVQAIPLIPTDGSFEENCSAASCSVTLGTTLGNDWNVTGVNGSATVTKNTLAVSRATNGQYFMELLANTSGPSANATLKNLYILQGGRIFYDVNRYVQGSTGGFFQFRYDFIDTNIGNGSYDFVNSGSAAVVQGLDKNFVLPNQPGRINFVVNQQGSFSANQLLDLDNIRWERYPIIDINKGGFITHVDENELFTITVSYYNGFTCTVTETTSGNVYSTTGQGDETYVTSPISFSLNPGSLSSTKNFTATCNGLSNSDVTWKIKVNKNNLIANNGGFDTNGTLTVSGSSSTAVKNWNIAKSTTGNGTFQIIKDTNTYIATDGQRYAKITAATESSSGTQQLKTLSSIKGGTVYFDVNAFTAGSASDPFDIYFEFDAGGTSSLFSSTSNVVGNDKNVVIPDAYGVLVFAVGSGTPTPGSVTIDNIRYTNSPSTLTLSTTPEFPIAQDTNVIMKAQYLDLDSNPILGANCDINVDDQSGTNTVQHDMSFNSDTNMYEYSQKFNIPTTYIYRVTCDGTVFTNQSSSSYFTVYENSPATTGMIITDLSNVTHEYDFDFNSASLNFTTNDVNFTPSDELDEIIFSIENTATSLQDININVLNSLLDGRQYFIYTATQSQYDDGTWQFDDSGTFGNTSSTPIQKIWHEELDKYIYTQNYSIGASDITYFKITYKLPHKHYFSIQNNSDWFENLIPTINDENTVIADQYFISSFSNIYSYLIENVPDVFGDETQAFEFQFTAWSDTSNIEMLVGQTINGSDSTTSVTLGPTPHTYSFTINATDFDSQVLFKTLESVPASVYITDYSIVPRGYFTKRLELFKSNGDALDLFLLNLHSKQYIQEGNDFKAKTQAYDREGNIQQLIVEAYFDTVGSDVNQVAKQVINLDTESEKTFDFDELLQGIIDLNGTAANPTQPRDLIVKASLIDDLGQTISIQSEAIKFLQFPYFGGDFTINLFPTEKQKGKNPSGEISIQSKNISTLEGLDIRIYDKNTSLSSPDYQKRIYKDQDFTCIGNSCNFSLKIDDYLFEDANVIHFVITALLNTEYFSLTNQLIQSDRIINVSQITFDTAKIYQVVQRADDIYRNDEEIPLVLILRDSEATSLKDKLNVYLTLQNCDNNSSGNCVAQTTKYYPTGYLYDDKYSYNYFFFRNFFLLDNGNVLPDGNYIGFRANVTDLKGVTQSTIPVLADKCQNNSFDAGTFFTGGLISFLEQVFSGVNGCNSQQFALVTTTDNNSQEARLHISANESTTSPSQEALLCINPDTNNVVGKPLQADQLCAVWYTVGEKPIDSFRMRISNQYSDFSKTGSDKQFVEFNVPYELIAYNDLSLLKAELETNQDTSINTIGDFVFESFRQLGKGLFIGQLQDKANFLLGNGLVTNIAGDINFNQAFSPAFVGGVVFYRVKGIPVVNMQDYRNDPKVKPIIEEIDPKQFLEYLSVNNVSVQSAVPSVDVIVSDYGESFKVNDINGHLVINEKPSTQPINKSNIDENNSATAKYQYIPSVLFFNVQNTMFYQNKSLNESLSVIFKITTITTSSFLNSILDFANGATDDPAAALQNGLYSNILWIVIFLGIVLVLAFIRNQLDTKSSG